MNGEKKSKHLRCRIILEMLGKPKGHIEGTLRKYVQKIKEEENLIILKEKFSDTKEQENLWTTFVELEMVIKNIPHLIGFCFDYMPSSIEILKPEEFTLKNRDISNFINDLQAKLHTVDMVAKKLKSENEFLKRNMKRSFENSILVLLKLKEMGANEISKFTGIDEKELTGFLDKLIENKKIKKEGENYSLI